MNDVSEILMVEWECLNCGHVWYEDSDALNYPDYCPECGEGVRASNTIDRTGNTYIARRRS